MITQIKICCVLLLAIGVILTGIAKADGDKDTNHAHNRGHLNPFPGHHYSTLIGNYRFGLLNHLGYGGKPHHHQKTHHENHHLHKRSASDEDSEQPPAPDYSKGFDQQYHHSEAHIPIPADDNVAPQSGIFSDIWDLNQFQDTENAMSVQHMCDLHFKKNRNKRQHHHDINEFLRSTPHVYEPTTPEPFLKPRESDDLQADQIPQNDDATNVLGKDPLGHDILTTWEPFKKSRSFDNPEDADHQAGQAQNDEAYQHNVFRTTPSNPFKKSRSLNEEEDGESENLQNDETANVFRTTPSGPFKKSRTVDETVEENKQQTGDTQNRSKSERSHQIEKDSQGSEDES